MKKYTETVIDSRLELPYTLIDIENASEHFVFKFISFDKGQTDFSIKNGGLTGQFGIKYTGKGMSCEFMCDITMGNVRDFGVALDSAYDNLSDPKVEMFNYGSPNRSCLSFLLSKTGNCRVKGKFRNKDNLYDSGIFFSFNIDESYYIPKTIHNIDVFFEEIYRLQGHNTFY